MFNLNSIKTSLSSFLLLITLISFSSYVRAPIECFKKPKTELVTTKVNYNSYAKYYRLFVVIKKSDTSQHRAFNSKHFLKNKNLYFNTIAFVNTKNTDIIGYKIYLYNEL
ncbi:hypothetical protein GCM10023315_03440 [Algibacter aquimarinus]|uniref:Uncharacterized protein n=1 Tax=Algibacter aquimarinus TaxID=1136748 RepID=A0ABP9H4R9_9FLAO